MGKIQATYFLALLLYSSVRSSAAFPYNLYLMVAADSNTLDGTPGFDSVRGSDTATRGTHVHTSSCLEIVTFSLWTLPVAWSRLHDFGMWHASDMFLSLSSFLSL